jgi:uncharacterized protein
MSKSESTGPVSPANDALPPLETLTLAPSSQELIRKVATYVEEYMNKFDGSHDYNHIRRVLGLARLIAAEILSDPANTTVLNPTTITLSALLHDVGDRKYLEPGGDTERLVKEKLSSFGAEEDLAEEIQRICAAVSWTSEMKDPGKITKLIEKHPELAVVQDADRLDSIGAVGIARVFMYGGAKTQRGLEGCVDMFEKKLLLLEESMKTAPGKRLAKERTERLKLWKGWWEEEANVAVGSGEVFCNGEVEGVEVAQGDRGRMKGKGWEVI